MDASFAEHLQMLPVEFAAFLIAVIFHEYAHGWMANRWGDKTAQEQGRLTLNPLPHIHPIGTVLFPILGMMTSSLPLFGWARPVPIDPRRFRKYRPGLISVALAGPGMNVLLAFFSAAALCALVRFVPEDFYLSEPLRAMARISIDWNYALCIFNLIPLTPLDGGRVVESFLKRDALVAFERASSFLTMGLLLLIFVMPNALSFLSGPISFCTNGTLLLVAHLFGIT